MVAATIAAFFTTLMYEANTFANYLLPRFHLRERPAAIQTSTALRKLLQYCL